MVTQEKGVIRSILRMSEAHILCYACHYFSYGVNKIRAASPTNMDTKPAIAIAISIITSWIDGGSDYGFL